ncbi:MAG: TetR/AcrR family transcriptional regulator [Butyricicoccus sp.]
MNASFFTLPEEKRNRLINVGYQVFARHEYRKASMAEIAAAAGISKSLLFYYFRNKQELYLFLWDCAAAETKRAVAEWGTLETDDFFELLTRSLRAKCSLMRTYPYLYAFSVRAYYEQEPDIRSAIQKYFQREAEHSEEVLWIRVDPGVFRPGLDLSLLYQEILWVSDGYLRQMYQSGQLDADKMEQDFLRMIEQWKKVYLR